MSNSSDDQIITAKSVDVLPNPAKSVDVLPILIFTGVKNKTLAAAFHNFLSRLYIPFHNMSLATRVFPQKKT